MRIISLLLTILISLVALTPTAYLSTASTQLKRGNLIMMAVLAVGETEQTASDCLQDKVDRNWQFVYFRDVKITNPYAGYVCVGFENDLLPNYGKLLKPNKSVTVKEAGKVLLYALSQKGLIDEFDIQSSGSSILKRLLEEGLLEDETLKFHLKIYVDDFLKFLTNTLYSTAQSPIPNPQSPIIEPPSEPQLDPRDEVADPQSDPQPEERKLVTDHHPDGTPHGTSSPYRPPVTTPPTPPNTPPNSAKTLPDANTRAMWVWGTYGTLKDNPTETQNFINFLKAPHGNTAYAINRVFMSRSSSLDFSDTADVQSMQNFLTTADSNGIDVELLLSDNSWVYTATKQNAIDLCQNVVDFNKSTASSDDDFKGIHFDIEPHTLPEWRDNTSAGTDNYNDELQANLLDIMTQCRAKIDASGLPITLSLDIPSNWHKKVTDVWIPLTATNSPVDYISIMNYFDSDYRFLNGWSADAGGVKNNLAAANGIPIMFGAEISDVTGLDHESVSFYEEGYLEMELAFSSAKSQYGTHPQFGGLVVHHYRTYKISTPLPPKYPLHKNITATYFYTGEPASAFNGFVHNYDSAWDEMWMEHFGGVDTPDNRNGHYPAGFTPLENPFYVALPYSDFDTNGRKANSSSVYWANEKAYASDESMIKNRWVKLTKDEDVIYAQWEDSGPFQHDDTSYVFGTSAPLNTENQSAGIDVSPAINKYLGLNGMAPVTWQFVDEAKVPDGPWKDIVTTSSTCWGSSCTWDPALTNYPTYSANDAFHKIRKYLVYYGSIDDAMADQIIADGYDMVIAHPMWGSMAGNNLTAPEIAKLKAGGVTVIGYMSFGEDDYADGSVVESYHIDKNNDGVPDQNPTWLSYYVNGNADWQALIQANLLQMSTLGYDGVFMDTLDTVSKYGGYPEYQANYLQMVKGTKAAFPAMYFIANNGFDLLLDYPYAQSITPDVSAVMIEYFDPLQSGDVTAANGLNAIRNNPANNFFHVIGLQYAVPTDGDYVRYLRGFRDYDMLGHISPSTGLDVYPPNY